MIIIDQWNQTPRLYEFEVTVSKGYLLFSLWRQTAVQRGLSVKTWAQLFKTNDVVS